MAGLVPKSTADEWLRDAAVRHWDSAMLTHGFTRTARSLMFTRKVDEGRQRIHLDLNVRPVYARDAFHLHPRCTIVFPAMAEVAGRMLEPVKPRFGRTGIVDVQPLDAIRYRPLMLFRSVEELDAWAPDILQNLTTWMVPYLDERRSIQALTEVEWHEWCKKPEPGEIGHTAVLVAAGRLTLGDVAGAAQALQTAYPQGTPGHVRFVRAFEVVAAAQG